MNTYVLIHGSIHALNFIFGQISLFVLIKYIHFFFFTIWFLIVNYGNTLEIKLPFMQ